MSTQHGNQQAKVATIIRNEKNASWGRDWNDLLQHRELLYFLTWRDIKVRYKQTTLGVLWAILQPLAIALSLSLFLSRVVVMHSGDLPYPVFAYSGMVIWQFFAQSLADAGNSLLANERLISKVYFPRPLVPIGAVMASLVDLVIGLLVLVGFLAYFQIPLKPSVIVLPVFVILTGILASGVGFWLSALNVKYRDVRYTINFLVQFWFFVSPIAYPRDVIPERWRLWYQLNPMVGAIEGFRWSLGGSGKFPATSFGISVAVAVVLFVSGLYYFRSAEDTFADFI
jgi:lipopolysaccharide transport system permease protein